VSLEAYLKLVRSQTVQGAEIHEADIRRVFEHLVLGDDVLERVGTAIVSGTSIFVYGPTGGGKTSIAETLPNIYPDSVWIPYAVEVDSQIIVVYDATTHRPVEQPPWGEADTRWVRCRRPRVFVGGELTPEMLDLQMNPISKFYSAPLQMKANNGVLIIDDFGRQRIRPEDLLNRWIVPLDRRVDFLTLRGGKKFEVPFDLFVVFATNLNRMELADEAFMRRIQNKIRLGYPSPRNSSRFSAGAATTFRSATRTRWSVISSRCSKIATISRCGLAIRKTSFTRSYGPRNTRNAKPPSTANP